MTILRIRNFARPLGRAAIVLPVAAMTAGLLTAAGPAQAAPKARHDLQRHGVQRIACPVQRVRSDIATRLPRAWSSQPTWAELQEARVVRAGRGRPQLVCDYGSAGEISRLAPRATRCRSRGDHFVCAAGWGRPVEPKLRTQGATRLGRRHAVDFDSDLKIDNRNSDIRLERAQGLGHALTPINGAAVWFSRGHRRSAYRDCLRPGEPMFRISLRDLAPGDVLCMRTAEGRVGQITVREVAPQNRNKLRIAYKVWEFGPEPRLSQRR